MSISPSRSTTILARGSTGVLLTMPCWSFPDRNSTRRALSARTYLVSLGLSADRLRTVSYGKEFPFDPGHDEAAWAKNRRAQFVLTSK